jgi:hypothetical protein
LAKEYVAILDLASIDIYIWSSAPQGMRRRRPNQDGLFELSINFKGDPAHCQNNKFPHRSW